MNTKPIRTLCRAALIACVIGAGSFSVADEAADDLQAGIDAFNSGDLPGAMTLYEKAAEAGSPEAYWYRAATDQGYPDGIGGLAEMYAKGEGVPTDLAKARELFEKAGEAGHAPSIRVLIGAYDQGGLDVERDEVKLAYWKDKQASFDDSED
jgi:TPR repeat protein